MKNILIIDTMAGNLFSLQAAIKRLGFNTTILSQPSDAQFDAVVIPGQGRFGTVLKNIRLNGWPQYLKRYYDQSVPILGICVGMQIFFEASDEDPESKGFAWFKGQANKLNFPKKPMVGWAKLSSPNASWTDACVYFVNSYAIKHSDCSVAETVYGEQFCAAIEKNSFTGVQFHPEKSGAVGSQIILNALTKSGQNEK